MKFFLSTIFAALIALPAFSAQASPSRTDIEEALSILREAALSPSADGPSADMVKSFSTRELANILKSEGYGSVQIKSPNTVSFKSNGLTIGLVRYDDGDLQLYYGASGVKVTAEVINEWNRDKRLSRAYLDKDRDVAIEADQFANAGLTKAMVKNFVGIFVTTSVPSYIEFVKRKSKN